MRLKERLRAALSSLRRKRGSKCLTQETQAACGVYLDLLVLTDGTTGGTRIVDRQTRLPVGVLNVEAFAWAERLDPTAERAEEVFLMVKGVPIEHVQGVTNGAG